MLPDKNITYYIVIENGQIDKVFDNENGALQSFESPLHGNERIVIRANVLRKKVLVSTEVEQI